jgi:hypothetical protein
MDRTTAAMAASSKGVLQSTRDVVWDAIEKAKELTGLSGNESILDYDGWGIGLGALQFSNSSSRMKRNVSQSSGVIGGNKAVGKAGSGHAGSANGRWRGNNYIQVMCIM